VDDSRDLSLNPTYINLYIILYTKAKKKKVYFYLISIFFRDWLHKVNEKYLKCMHISATFIWRLRHSNHIK